MMSVMVMVMVMVVRESVCLLLLFGDCWTRGGMC